MKSFINIFILLIAFSFSKAQCDNAPVLNKKIIAFVKSNMNKKVDGGECWDLAAKALKNVEANWDGKYEFGKHINDKKDCVYPGDIIQFKGIKLKYKKEKYIYTEDMSHHTAIVYEVVEKGKYIIADQNTRHSGRKVGTHEFNVEDIIKGSFKIYRPQN
ncbi:MAG: hypothetical protein KDD29_11255 [Flavobacteriales bacterium]|nr:hypothetical protein [Flavobacteriales bacterium]